MKKMAVALATVALGAVAGSAAAEVNVWSTTFSGGNFENVGPFPQTSLALSFGGGSIQGAQSLPGFGGDFFRNDTSGTTQFGVGGLGAHSALHLSFDLAFIDSWDSTDGNPAPDLLNVSINGLAPYAFTTNNASGSVVDFGPGVVTGPLANYGFNNSWGDVVVHYDFLFAHTDANWTMRINFGGAGFQGGLDESWGIDNFSLAAIPPNTEGGVPEPASWALMIMGFGLSGAVLRRRRGALA